jgi:DNA topoisomerase-1
MGGLITYHRTDSTTLSDKALNESARVIREMFGGEYLRRPRRYQTRVKNAQEAHEAIRPTDFRLAPSQLEGFSIRRAQGLRVDLEADDGVADGGRPRPAHVLEISAQGPKGETAVLTASGKAIEFAGFRRAYVEGSDDPAAELEEQEAILPQCAVAIAFSWKAARPSTAMTLLGPSRSGTRPRRRRASRKRR